MRLGYIIGLIALISKLVQLKQAADLHTLSFTQYIAYQVIKDGYLLEHISNIRKLYQHRCQFMLQQLEKYMPKQYIGISQKVECLFG